MTEPETLGSFCAYLRKSAPRPNGQTGYTQDELAALSKLSVPTISNIETGKDVRPETLRAIYLKKLKCSREDWQKIIALFCVQVFGDESDPEAIAENMKVAEMADAYASGARVQELAGIISHFPEPQAKQFIRFAKLAASEPAVFDLVNMGLTFADSHMKGS